MNEPFENSKNSRRTIFFFGSTKVLKNIAALPFVYLDQMVQFTMALEDKSKMGSSRRNTSEQFIWTNNLKWPCWPYFLSKQYHKDHFGDQITIEDTKYRLKKLRWVHFVLNFFTLLSNPPFLCPTTGWNVFVLLPWPGPSCLKSALKCHRWRHLMKIHLNFFSSKINKRNLLFCWRLNFARKKF